jgi:hypothetical protein
MHDRHWLNQAVQGPHPAFVRKLTLLPSFGRAKAKPLEIVAFSRAARMGEGARRADEGFFRIATAKTKRPPKEKACHLVLRGAGPVKSGLNLS